MGYELDAYGYGRSLWGNRLISSDPDNHLLEMRLILEQGRGYVKSLWSDRSIELAIEKLQAEKLQAEKLKAENRSQTLIELTGDQEFALNRLSGLKIALAQPSPKPTSDALKLTIDPSSTTIDLYGFDGSAVRKLLAIDLCGQHDLVGMKSLKDAALDLGISYDSYIVTGHLPKNCDAKNPDLILSKLFKNSGLAGWTRILQDQYYAGVVFTEGGTLEMTAEASQASTIRFVN